MAGPDPGRARAARWLLPALVLGLAVALLAVWRAGGAESGGERATPAPARAERPSADEPDPGELAPAKAAIPGAGGARAPVATEPAAPGARESPPSVVRSGRVREQGTLVPVAGATVELAAGERTASATTDAEGRFELAWPAGLPADLAARAEGFVPTRVPDARPDEPLDLRLRRGARIEGTVVLAEPWNHPRVHVWHVRTSSERYWDELEVPVAEDGTFAAEGLEPGTYTLAASARGGTYARRIVTWELGVDLAPGESRTVALEAQEGAKVEGRVHAKEGDDLQVEVRAVPTTPGLPDVLSERVGCTAWIDDSRQFLFALPPGPYRVEVLQHGSVEKSRAVELEPGERQFLLFELLGRRTVTGVVLDERGAPLPGAAIAAFPAGRPVDLTIGFGPEQARALGFESFEGLTSSHPQTRGGVHGLRSTDADGRFVLTGLPRQEAVRVAAWRNFDPGRGPSAVLETGVGESVDDLVLQLAPRRAVRGEVRAASGEPIEGARVEAGDGSGFVTAWSDARGEFELQDVPPEGDFRVRAEGWLPLELALAPGLRDEALTLVLEPAAFLHGRAVTSRGEAIEGQPVIVRSEEERARCTTDAFGRFALALAPGAWDVTSSSYAWRLTGSDPRAVELPSEDELVLVFAPRDRPERASITAVVESADGGPVEGLRVEGFVGGSYVLDGSELRATGLTPTRHSLLFRADGHLPRRVAKIDLRPGQEVDLGLVLLEPAAELTVVLKGPDGKPVQNAEVRLVDGPAEQRDVRVPRRDGGRYVTAHAPRGAWTLRVEAPGHAPLAVALEVEPQAKQRVELVLP